MFRIEFHFKNIYTPLKFVINMKRIKTDSTIEYKLGYNFPLTKDTFACRKRV